jgi:hypothetical protein
LSFSFFEFLLTCKLNSFLGVSIGISSSVIGLETNGDDDDCGVRKQLTVCLANKKEGKQFSQRDVQVVAKCLE